MTTLPALSRDLEKRGFKPINAPALCPVGNTTLAVADDGNGCALLLFRHSARDEFWRIPWTALDAGRVLDQETKP